MPTCPNCGNTAEVISMSKGPVRITFYSCTGCWMGWEEPSQIDIAWQLHRYRRSISMDDITRIKTSFDSIEDSENKRNKKEV